MSAQEYSSKLLLSLYKLSVNEDALAVVTGNASAGSDAVQDAKLILQQIQFATKDTSMAYLHNNKIVSFHAPKGNEDACVYNDTCELARGEPDLTELDAANDAKSFDAALKKMMLANIHTKEQLCSILTVTPCTQDLWICICGGVVTFVGTRQEQMKQDSAGMLHKSCATIGFQLDVTLPPPSSARKTMTAHELRASLKLKQCLAGFQYTFRMGSMHYTSSMTRMKDRTLKITSTSTSTSSNSVATATQAALSTITVYTNKKWNQVVDVLYTHWLSLSAVYHQEQNYTRHRALVQIKVQIQNAHTSTSRNNDNELKSLSFLLVSGIILLVRMEHIEEHLAQNYTLMDAFMTSMSALVTWMHSLWWFALGEVEFMSYGYGTDEEGSPELEEILRATARQHIECVLFEPSPDQAVAMQFVAMWQKIDRAKKSLKFEQGTLTEYQAYVKAGRETFESLAKKSEIACNNLHIQITEEEIKMIQLGMQHPRIHQEQDLYHAYQNRPRSHMHA